MRARICLIRIATTDSATVRAAPAHDRVRTQLSLNGGTSATYQYDVINRLTQLTDDASLNTTFAYDATNKLTSHTLPNGVVTSYQYDGLDRLTRLTHSKGANTLADFQYQFNAVGNITQITDDAGASNYSYDPLDRLTAATHPNQTNESYTFDDVGNRTASQQGSSYSYQAFNRLVAANGASFGYDGNGSLTSKTDASGSWTYSWDYENRLKQASKAGGVTVIYAYDALGRRVQQTSSAGGTKKFVYDGADVIRDLDASGGTIVDYLNGPGIDNKLRQTASGAVYYFATDHLGTTRALTDASGSLTSTLNYDSFGSVIDGSASTRYTYTGRERDTDTGLMYYRARWYDSAQGRFVSEDPIAFKGGLNFYAYVGNNPVGFTDPSGLQRPDARWQPGELEWANDLRKQMDKWPSTPECSCDQSNPEVVRRAQEVVDRYPGTRLVIDPNQAPHLEFPDSFDDVTDNLTRAGYYTGFPWAYNPQHYGGTEFRTYGSPGFHFTVGYPPTGQGYGPYPGISIWYPALNPPPPRTIDMHIDCRNPVGAGWKDRVLHFFDFLGQGSRN